MLATSLVRRLGTARTTSSSPNVGLVIGRFGVLFAPNSEILPYSGDEEAGSHGDLEGIFEEESHP